MFRLVTSCRNFVGKKPHYSDWSANFTWREIAVTICSLKFSLLPDSFLQWFCAGITLTHFRSSGRIVHAMWNYEIKWLKSPVILIEGKASWNEPCCRASSVLRLPLLEWFLHLFWVLPMAGEGSRPSFSSFCLY